MVGKLFNFIFGGIQLIAGIFLAATGVGAGFGLKLIIAGGLTILAGLRTETGRSGFESSPTYGFNNVRNDIAEGAPVRVIYGEVKVALQYISVNVQTSRRSQRLRILGLVGEGEVERIGGIKINGVDAASYGSVGTFVRYGTADQTVIPGFGETGTVFDRSTVLSKDVVHIHSTSDACDEIELALNFRGGLFRRDNKGRWHRVDQEIKVEFKRQGENDSLYKPYTPVPYGNAGDWSPKGAGVFGFGGTYGDAIFTSFRIKFPSRGDWVIRLTGRLDSDPPNNKISDYTLETIIEIKNDNNAYPGYALIGVDIGATGQLADGIPAVTAIVRGRKVYNPKTLQTEWTQNRAWCIRDLLLNTTFGLGDWVEALEIDDGLFGTWRDVADELDAGEGGPIVNGSYSWPADQLDYVIDVRAKAGDHLAQMLAGGRLSLFVTEGVIKIARDSLGDIERVFQDDETPGERHNIVRVEDDDGARASTLIETSLPYSERFTVIRVRYVDRAEDHEPRTVTVRDATLELGPVLSGPGFIDGEELQSTLFKPAKVGEIRCWLVKAPPTAGGVVHIIQNPDYDVAQLGDAWVDRVPFPVDTLRPVRFKGVTSGTEADVVWPDPAAATAGPTIPKPEVVAEIQLFGVTREAQAVWEARYHLNRAIFQTRIYDMALYLGDTDLEPHDVTDLRALRLSDDPILVRVLALSYGHDGRGRVQCIVYDPAVYNVRHQPGPENARYADAPQTQQARTLADVLTELGYGYDSPWYQARLAALLPKTTPPAPGLPKPAPKPAPTPTPPTGGAATGLTTGSPWRTGF